MNRERIAEIEEKIEENQVVRDQQLLELREKMDEFERIIAAQAETS